MAPQPQTEWTLSLVVRETDTYTTIAVTEKKFTTPIAAGDVTDLDHRFIRNLVTVRAYDVQRHLETRGSLRMSSPAQQELAEQGSNEWEARATRAEETLACAEAIIGRYASADAERVKFVRQWLQGMDRFTWKVI